ncbi:MAG: HAD-IC family P-type ATPase, partial [Oscillospiraceae bacterium]|nr:HAD-IC family P-type ATPase [Oscillospiraceae bacterium]
MYYNDAKGLSEEEVRRSREEYGENRLSLQKSRGFFKSFLSGFGDPMIKILLIALAINVIFLFKQGNWFESFGIAAAILLATLVSTLSEYGSESAFEKLQEEASRVNCRVRRKKGLKEIPADEVVVGDIVLLQPGDRIPADGVIIEGRLDADQSSVNGESREAKKYPCDAALDANKKPDDFSAPSLLFSGTVVCAGEAYMRVTGVGDNTVYGRIGAEIQFETRESPLKLRLGKLAGTIGKFSYFAAAFTALA